VKYPFSLESLAGLLHSIDKIHKKPREMAMKITVIGCGYVGLVTAACLAGFGHTVTGVEKDPAKVSA
jgi:UDP-N-acetyl-D-mannosaminuronate dehydrogenase